MGTKDLMKKKFFFKIWLRRVFVVVTRIFHGTWTLVVARRLSTCGAQAQYLWRAGLVVLWHVGS